jgi:NAD-dependent dihydropyrimidine dehydrogenase PreA subunit
MIGASLPLRVYLYAGPLCSAAAPGGRASLIARLLQRGIAVNVVNDHTALSPCKLSDTTRTVVLGEFNGSVPAGLPDDSLDVSGKTADEVLALVEGEGAQSAEAKPRFWKPWFPVIDFKRCTNCMQCLSFCLFDVYGVTGEGKIQVQNENNCKTDCPACSRVCPEVAIMFPKYKAGPINGEEVNSDDVRREAMKVDISALLGGDIYSMLRDRSERAKSRFSKERDDERALKERQRCLDKLKSSAADFDVPPELLASLPSADQIQFKAEQARKRAADALQLQAAAQAAASANGPTAIPTTPSAEGA